MKSIDVPLVKKSNIKDNSLPVVIIGAGPIGLATAAHLRHYKQPFIILEAGPEVGNNLRTWKHVRLFSSWKYNMDKAAVSLLKQYGWKEPDLNKMPNGSELIEQYLQPLANVPEIKKSLLLQTKVRMITRKNVDKMKTTNRAQQSFLLYVEQNGQIKQIEAKAVIDASGTWGNPNPAISNGGWLKNEEELNEHIFYGIPDCIGKDISRYQNKKVAVVGGGHSAINSLIDLSALKETHRETEIVWIMRKEQVQEAYGGEKQDQLAARGELGGHIHHLVEKGIVQVRTPFYIEHIGKEAGKIKLVGCDQHGRSAITNIDEIIVNTGNRPDLSFLREIRISIDTVTESVAAIAPLIDPNIHSCGTVCPHGEKELRQPEKGFYIAGAKSYGRAPTFLLATGYEQVRSIVAYLAGDVKASTKIELDLPETGVCKTNIHATSTSTHINSCCS